MVDGFLVIDKPAGISSHDVVNRVRRILGTRKVGHTGTLDPFATGVLPIAVGEGTKAIPFLDEGTKEYLATIWLGMTTDSLDRTGTVLRESDASCVAEASLLREMAALTGEISQLPPMYSAVKQGGRPLYKLARKGLEVERKPRRVMIHRFELLACDPPVVQTRVVCSRGTYVRSLADDLGALLGCGACLAELRRTMSGPFRLEEAVTLEQLAEAAARGSLDSCLRSLLQALDHLPVIDLSAEQQQRLRHGVLPQELPHGLPAGYVAFRWQQQLIAVAQLDEGGQPTLKRVFN